MLRAEFHLHKQVRSLMWPQAWDVETARYDPSYAAGSTTLFRLHAGPSFELSDTPIRQLEWRVTGIDGTVFEKTIVATADLGEHFPTSGQVPVATEYPEVRGDVATGA